MKFINPYVKNVFLSCLILFGFGAISIAPIWLAFIGIFWSIPFLKGTDNYRFFFTGFALIAMLIIRTFLFEDFQGTLLLIPYMVATIGMICDGAKAGCALKVSTCTNAAVQAALLAVEGLSVHFSEGIVEDDPEKTIDNVCKLANNSTTEIDKIILNIILKKRSC